MEKIDIVKEYGRTADGFARVLDYNMALEVHTRALSIYERELLKIEYPVYEAVLYMNIGLSHKNISDYDKALKFFAKSLVIYQKEGLEYSFDAAKLYNNIGEVYQEMGELNKALEMHEKALSIQTKGEAKI